MSFRVVLPGSPPSTNHAYKMATQRRGNVPFRTLVKTDEAVAYQRGVKLKIATAKPTGFDVKRQLRIEYRLYLAHRQDADNSLKMLNDAIAGGLGCNDDLFLPTVVCKHVVGPAKARVEVTISHAGPCGCEESR